jgi:hypothetical protein
MKKALRYSGIIFLLIFFCSANNAPAADNASAQKKQDATGIIAYYFHGNFRCATCRAIEQLSREAIEKNFKEQLKSGALTFLIINIDEPENEHFIQDYQLMTRSLVIAQIKNNKQVAWKNLPGVWKYVRDEKAFDNYVKTEIQSYLQGS